MSTDTPRPERVTLSDEEREALRVTINLARLAVQYSGRGVVARMHDDEDVDFMMETIAPAVECILAPREQALREEIAGEIEARGTVVGLDAPGAAAYRLGYEVAQKSAARIARGGA